MLPHDAYTVQITQIKVSFLLQVIGEMFGAKIQQGAAVGTPIGGVAYGNLMDNACGVSSQFRTIMT